MNSPEITSISVTALDCNKGVCGPESNSLFCQKESTFITLSGQLLLYKIKRTPRKLRLLFTDHYRLF